MSGAAPPRDTGLGEGALRAALARTWATPRGLWGFLTTVDHKAVGRRYITTAFFFLGLAGNQKAYAKTEALESVFGSSKTVDAFFTKYKMYKAPVKYEDYFDGSLVEEVAKAGK